MNDKNRKRLEEAYEHAHLEAVGALETIQELLHDLPAPGDDEHPIHWGHVGDVNEVLKRLESVIAFLEGTEK